MLLASMGDVILVQGMRVPASLGVTAAERGLRRPVEIDLELEADLRVAGRTDRIAQTVNYSEVYAVVEKIARERQYRLVEALGTSIADALLDGFPIDSCTVTVRKPTPVAANLSYAGVRITRRRSSSEG